MGWRRRVCQGVPLAIAPEGDLLVEWVMDREHVRSRISAGALGGSARERLAERQESTLVNDG